MRLLKAVIIAANKKTGIKVRLESGLITIVLPFEKKYHVGQPVSVAYDFTEKSPARIIDSNYNSENIPEAQIKKRGGEDNDPEDPEMLELLRM
jgi:hypothetical protein